MKLLAKLSLATGLVFAGLFSNLSAATFGEDPQGSYWHPVSPSGTFVYAQSFTAPVSGDVTSLGTWLNDYGISDPTTQLVFEILGSAGGLASAGPDISLVLAATGPISGIVAPEPTYFSGSATSYSKLIAGNTYWFAINAIGGHGTGVYQVSQANDDLKDGGSFWFSNDSSGSYFDGRGLKPEMAFSVTVNEKVSVPDASSSLVLLAGGLVGLAALRRRRA